jgi:hypothetical protein
MKAGRAAAGTRSLIHPTPGLDTGGKALFVELSRLEIPPVLVPLLLAGAVEAGPGDEHVVKMFTVVDSSGKVLMHRPWMRVVLQVGEGKCWSVIGVPDSGYVDGFSLPDAYLRKMFGTEIADRLANQILRYPSGSTVEGGWGTVMLEEDSPYGDDEKLAKSVGIPIFGPMVLAMLGVGLVDTLRRWASRSRGTRRRRSGWRECPRVR